MIDGKPQLFLKAIQDIQEEQELHYDYNIIDAKWRQDWQVRKEINLSYFKGTCYDPQHHPQKFFIKTPILVWGERSYLAHNLGEILDAKDVSFRQ